MPGSIRVVYQPSTHLTGDRVAVLGAVVKLSRFGQTPSALSLEQEHRAELVFHAAFLAQARKVSQPDFQPFANVSGTIKLVQGEPKLTFSTGTELQYLGERAEGPRTLELQFGSGFSNEATDTLNKIELPSAPENARFLELGVELKVDGGTEATLQQNDRLDVPLEGMSFFEAEVVDDEDVPLANRDYTLELSDGSTITGRSDAQGVVRLDPIFGAKATLRISEESRDAESESADGGAETNDADDGGADGGGADDGSADDGGADGGSADDGAPATS